MLDFSKLQDRLKDEAAPLMLVDLESFDANLEKVFSLCERKNKKFRPATKSLRVPWLIERILNHPKASEWVSGLMLFSVYEARYWWDYARQKKLNLSLLVAYPLASTAEIGEAARLTREGCNLVLMADSSEQIEWHASVVPNVALRFCLDIDMSWRPFGGKFHLGVRRSSLQNAGDLKKLLQTFVTHKHLQLTGLMGYEAQVAGMTDNGPFNSWQNTFKKFIRLQSAKIVAKRRNECSEVALQWLSQHGKNSSDFFINGGGTGSLTFAQEEPWLTEVTMGSGLLQSHLFDYYSNDCNRPALFFALPISRRPAPGFLTLKSGGFIASGESGADKAPVVINPNLSPLAMEGFGEVQTPVSGDEALLAGYHLGDWVICRPSKAGEIAERFNHYFIVDKVGGASKVPTYRGLGLNFF